MLYAMSELLADKMETGHWIDLSLFTEVFASFGTVVLVWCCMFLTVCFVYSLLRWWASCTRGRFMCAFMYSVLQTGFFIIPPWIVLRDVLPVGSSTIIVLEHGEESTGSFLLLQVPWG